MNFLRRIPIVSILLLALAPGVPAEPFQGGAEASSPAAVAPEPTIEDVYVVMRDMDLAYETAEIRTIVPNEAGASVLVGLPGGTLVHVEVSPVAQGWVLRNVYYVSGSAEEFGAWTTPWRNRVAEAQRFLAAAGDDGQPRRRAEELAPLMWFEDIEPGERLWGMNPTTYRIMQTLKMMPNLAGPMGGGIRRDQ